MYSSFEEGCRVIRALAGLKHGSSLASQFSSRVGILALSIAIPAQVYGENLVKLSAKPDSCVALHRGQRCFMTVKLSWSTTLDSDVCIHIGNAAEPLICVVPTQRAVSVEYQSPKSMLFSLKERNKTKVLADVMVQTVWVHRSSRRSSSGWRLF